MTKLENTASSGEQNGHPIDWVLPGCVNQVVIPDAHLMFSGSYKRVGSSLLIEGDGKRALVLDYFEGGGCALASRDGALLDADTVRSLAGQGSGWVFAQAGGGAAVPVEIGTIRTLTGTATVVRGSSTQALAVGQPVYQGDVVQTGGNSSVGIILRDQTVFSLSSDARMVLNSLVYDPARNDNSMAATLVQGVFVFVTGLATRSGSATVTTPVATMGIRGTTPIVKLSALDGSGEFSLGADPGGTVGSYILTRLSDNSTIATVDNTSIVIRINSASGQVETSIKTDAEQQIDAQILGGVYSLYRLIGTPVAPDRRGEAPGEPGQGQKEANASGNGQTNDPFATTLSGQTNDLLGNTGFDQLFAAHVNSLLGDTGFGSTGGEIVLTLGDLRTLLGSSPPPPGFTFVFDLNGLTPGVDDVLGFTENGPPLSVAPNIALNVPSGSVITSATVILNGTPLLPGDNLIVPATLPGGITAAVTFGSIIVTLSNNAANSATSEDFAAAIQAILFENASDDPTGTPRTIDITMTFDDGTIATATTTIDVTPVNDAPTVSPLGPLTTGEDGTLAGAVLASDAENDPITFVIVQSPSQGSFVFDPATGSFIYQPNADFSGTDSFAVAASDGTDTSAPQTVTISITPVNDAPVAEPQTIAILEDQPHVGQLVATDVDSPVLSYRIVSGPADGASLVLDEATGAFTYTPAENSTAADSFTFVAKDGEFDSAPQTVTISITPVNDAPVAEPQTIAILEDQPHVGQLVATDVDSPVLSYRIVSGPADGASLVLDEATGAFTYTPAENSTAADSFTFVAKDGEFDSAPQTVTISITPVNDAPVAEPQTIAILEDQPHVGQLVATDVDGPVLSYRIVSGPADGAGLVLDEATGALTYTPAGNETVGDSFTFVANDGELDSAPQTVTISITPVNDAPTGTDGTIVVADSATRILSAADFGFTDPDDVPNDAFDRVLIQPLAGVGTLTFAGDVVGGPLTVAVADIALLVYTPPVSGGGTATLAFQVADDGGTVNGGIDIDADANTITFDVVVTNIAPDAVDDTVSTAEDTPLLGNVLTGVPGGGSDIDANGDALTVSSATFNGSPITLGVDTALVVGATTFGSILLATDGSYAFTPAANLNGVLPDIAYTIEDGRGGTDAAALRITVTPVDDAPEIVAGDTSGVVQEDTTLTASGVLVASDPDIGDTQAWTVDGGTPTTAAAFTFYLDTLRVEKNGSQIFLDTFDDNVPAPSGPFGAATYGLNGTPQESDGRMILNSAFGASGEGVGTDDPFINNNPVLRTNISNPAATTFLGQTDDFTVEATFDLILPDDRREAYGVRLRDRLIGGTGTPPDNLGDDVIELVVRNGADGIVRVQFRETDFAADTVRTLQSIVVTPPPDATQIVLRLEHQNETAGAVYASFDYLDSSGAIVGSAVFTATGDIYGTGTPTDTSDDENWTRAQIVAWVPVVTASTYDGAFGALAIDQTGAWTYTLDNSLLATQSLAHDQEVSDTFDVRVTDATGLSDSETVTVAVRGTNDPVVLTTPPSVTRDLGEDDAVPTLTASGLTTFSDVDASDSHTVGTRLESTSLSDGAALPVGLSPLIEAAFSGVLTQDSTDVGTGRVDWSFTLDSSAVQFLAAGQVLTLQYAIDITENLPSGVAQTVTQRVYLDIAGVNDAPVAADDVVSTDANVAVSGNVITGVPGGGIDTDVDSATLSVSSFEVDGAVYNPGDTVELYGSVSLEYGALTIEADGSYLFEPDPGWSGTVPDVTYTITDGSGGSASAILAITVLPGSSAPEITRVVNILPVDSWESEGFAIDASGLVVEPVAIPLLATDTGTAYRLTTTAVGNGGAIWQPIEGGDNLDMQVRLNFGATTNGADGIAFVLHGAGPTALTDAGQAGGSVGAQGFPSGGIPNAIGIVLDTFDNALPTDSAGNSIAFFVNDASGATAAIGSPVLLPTPLENGQWHTLRVGWDPELRELAYELFLFEADGSPAPGSPFSGSQIIPIDQVPTGDLRFGFTSSTGLLSADNQVETIYVTLGTEPDNVPVRALVETGAPLTAFGQIEFYDPDPGAAPVASYAADDPRGGFAVTTSGGVILDGTQQQGLADAFTIVPTGAHSFSFDLAAAGIVLAAGQTITLEYTVVVSDAGGAFDTAVVTYDIVGRDIAPTLDLNGVRVASVGWLHDLPENTTAADLTDPTRIGSATDEQVGSGFLGADEVPTLDGGVRVIPVVDASDLAGAIAAEHYLGYSFRTADALPVGAALSLVQVTHGDGTGDYRYAVEISADPSFATSTLLIADADGNPNGGLAFVSANNVAPFALQAGTDYHVRVYFFGHDGSGPDIRFDNFNLAISDASTNSGTSYLAGGPAVFISGGPASTFDPSIVPTFADEDSFELARVDIRLTNAQFGDELFVNEALGGALPGDIASSGYDAGSGVLTLSGLASLADYERAIALVAYINTEVAPADGERVIHVIAYDETGAASNLAVSRIAVATPFAPLVAGDDSATALSDLHSFDSSEGDERAPLVSGPAAGNVLDNDTGTGTLSVLSVTNANGTETDVLGPDTIVEGFYGTLTISPDGSYTYAPRDAEYPGRPIEALSSMGRRSLDTGSREPHQHANASLRDTFTYTVGDNTSTTETTLEITIDPSRTSIFSQSDSALMPSISQTVSGNLLFNDLTPQSAFDSPEIVTVDRLVGLGYIVPATSVDGNTFELTGRYGKLTVTESGNYVYELDRTNPAIAGLAPGAILADDFTYTVRYGDRDGNAVDSNTLFVQINGSAAQPDIAAIDEDNGTLASPVSVLVNDAGLSFVSAVELLDGGYQPVGAAGATIPGSFGELVMQADGSWTYAPDQTFLDTLNFPFGSIAADTFFYQAQTTPDGPVSIGELKIFINGVDDPISATPAEGNDVPVFSFAAGLLPTGFVVATDVRSAVHDPDTPIFDTELVSDEIVVDAGDDGQFTVSLSLDFVTLRVLAVDWAPGSDFAPDDRIAVPVEIEFTNLVGETVTSTVTFDLLGAFQPIADNSELVTLEEAGGVANSEPGTSFASGNLLDLAVDEDGPGDPLTITEVFGISGLVGAFIDFGGVLVQIQSDGSYSVSLDDEYADIEALTSSTFPLSYTINYTVTDSKGLSDGSGALTIEVLGADDAPEANSDTRNVGALDGGLSFTYTDDRNLLANDTDVDDYGFEPLTVIEASNGVTTVVPSTGGSVLPGAYGTLEIFEDGSYTYTIDASLPAASLLEDVFDYTAADSSGLQSTTTLTIRIHEGLETVEAVADTALAYEAGGLDNATPGLDPTGNVLDNDRGSGLVVVGISAPVAGNFNGTVGAAISGLYGTLLIDADGTYRYAVDNNANEDLPAGFGGFDRFTYVVEDVNGERSTAELGIDLLGQDDAPRSVPANYIVAEDDLLPVIRLIHPQFQFDAPVDADGEELSVVAGSIAVTADLATAAGTVLRPVAYTINMSPGEESISFAPDQFEYLQSFYEGGGFGEASGTPDRLTITVSYLVTDGTTERNASVTLDVIGDADYFGLASAIDIVDFADPSFAFNTTYGYRADGPFGSLAVDEIDNFDATRHRIDISELLDSAGIFVDAGNLADIVKATVDTDGIELTIDDGTPTVPDPQITAVINGTAGSDQHALGIGDTITIVFDQSQPAAHVTVVGGTSI